MKKVLFFLGEFADQDIDWIVGAGTRQTVNSGEALITEGQPVEVLAIVLRGKFSIQASGKAIAEIGNGELVGELSFLDARPPSASVIATKDSTVLAIAKTRLTAKLESDLAFASRFYRALGVLLAYRMRDTVAQLAYGGEKRLDQEVDPNELGTDMLDRVSLAAVRFDQIMERTLT